MSAAKSQVNRISNAGNDLGANENDTVNKYQANQIFMLQKNIEFLKKNHQEMLMTLHSEIEKLKKSNAGNKLILL